MGFISHMSWNYDVPAASIKAVYSELSPVCLGVGDSGVGQQKQCVISCYIVRSWQWIFYVAIYLF